MPTYTYSGNPATSPTDEIRFLLQDVDSTDWLLSDEEIQYFSTLLTDLNGSTFQVAAYLAGVIAGRFAREVSISGDGISIQAEQLQQKYEDLAVQLRSMATSLERSGNGPTVGGIGESDDLWYGGRPKTFSKQMHDNYR